jgi:hypothetical protein
MGIYAGRRLVEAPCAGCGSVLRRRRDDLARRGGIVFCSQACYCRVNRPKCRVTVACLLCGVHVQRKPSEVRKAKNGVFCCQAHASEAVRKRLIPGGRPRRSTTRAAGHCRARAMFPPAPCVVCGRPGQRHHRDNNPLNNDPSNVVMLCGLHHMTVDGRLQRLKQQASKAGRARASQAQRDERGKFSR